MGSTDDPPETDQERPRLSPGRVRAVSLFARLEFAASGLLAIAVCAGRMTAFSHDAGPLWALLGVLVVPAFVMAAVLTIVHARHVKRPLPTVWPELAFWAVAPVSAAILLIATSSVR